MVKKEKKFLDGEEKESMDRFVNTLPSLPLL